MLARSGVGWAGGCGGSTGWVKGFYVNHKITLLFGTLTLLSSARGAVKGEGEEEEKSAFCGSLRAFLRTACTLSVRRANPAHDPPPPTSKQRERETETKIEPWRPAYFPPRRRLPGPPLPPLPRVARAPRCFGAPPPPPRTVRSPVRGVGVVRGCGLPLSYASYRRPYVCVTSRYFLLFRRCTTPILPNPQIRIVAFAALDDDPRKQNVS